MKHAAAHYLCEKSGHSVEDVYGKILTIAAEARGCYVDDAVTRFGDVEFAAMMFLDGCFLLQYIRVRMLNNTGPPSLAHLFYSKRSVINNDIMLLENQLPWLVIEALMEVDVDEFIVAMGDSVSSK